MRTLLICLLGWSLGFTLAAQSVQNPPNGVPYTTNGFLAVINFDQDGRDDSSYVLSAHDRGGGTLVVPYFESDEFTSYLANKQKKADFAEGERIASTNKIYLASSGVAGLAPDAYQWSIFFVLGVPIHSYSRFDGDFTTLTNALVGVRFFGGDNFYHHAWIRLTRPDNLPGTPFLVDSHNYNPLPDEPIGAGLPPPVPPLTFTVSTDGFLLLTWMEKAVPYYKLQSRPDLFDPDGWQDVPTGEEHTFTTPLDGEAGYYRLTRR